MINKKPQVNQKLHLPRTDRKTLVLMKHLKMNRRDDLLISLLDSDNVKYFFGTLFQDESTVSIRVEMITIYACQVKQVIMP